MCGYFSAHLSDQAGYSFDFFARTAGSFLIEGITYPFSISAGLAEVMSSACS
jgi:hypothetical protein